jgi:hypothetical protein
MGTFLRSVRRAAILVLVLGAPAAGAAADFELRFPICTDLLKGALPGGEEPFLVAEGSLHIMTCSRTGRQVVCDEGFEWGRSMVTFSSLTYVITRDRPPALHFGTGPEDQTVIVDTTVKVDTTEQAAIRTTVVFTGTSARVTVCHGTYRKRVRVEQSPVGPRQR